MVTNESASLEGTPKTLVGRVMARLERDVKTEENYEAIYESLLAASGGLWRKERGDIGGGGGGGGEEGSKIPSSNVAAGGGGGGGGGGSPLTSSAPSKADSKGCCSIS